jgi:hypothetical protein
MSDFEVILRDVGFQMCQFPGFIVRCRFSEVSVFWVSLRDAGFHMCRSSGVPLHDKGFQRCQVSVSLHDVGFQRCQVSGCIV